ncbi:hypothetical protein Ae406Ps2_6245 [Pseudonocardia sp. Ae406_Ps2]|nr:hypothetical protein Ae406Ps2_6245 [Pseudonocardia sp. Ae406_Ps2]
MAVCVCVWVGGGYVSLTCWSAARRAVSSVACCAARCRVTGCVWSAPAISSAESARWRGVLPPRVASTWPAAVSNASAASSVACSDPRFHGRPVPRPSSGNGEVRACMAVCVCVWVGGGYVSLTCWSAARRAVSSVACCAARCRVTGCVWSAPAISSAESARWRGVLPPRVASTWPAAVSNASAASSVTYSDTRRIPTGSGWARLPSLLFRA